MWHNHPLSQRNKTVEIAVEVRVESDKQGEVGQNLKKGGRQYRWVFLKEGVRRRPTGSMTSLHLIVHHYKILVHFLFFLKNR